ncbi:MAG: hypothetical protein R3C68_09965 [Myxococcota bacterium]
MMPDDTHYVTVRGSVAHRLVFDGNRGVVGGHQNGIQPGWRDPTHSKWNKGMTFKNIEIKNVDASGFSTSNVDGMLISNYVAHDNGVDAHDHAVHRRCSKTASLLFHFITTPVQTQTCTVQVE